MRRSVAGPFPHFIHADDLPEDLPVRQFVPNPGVPCDILFEGHEEEALGSVKPPPVKGAVDWGLLLFWLIYLIGCFKVFGWLWALGKRAIQQLLAMM
jgi:hypothetical protein